MRGLRCTRVSDERGCDVRVNGIAFIEIRIAVEEWVVRGARVLRWVRVSGERGTCVKVSESAEWTRLHSLRFELLLWFTRVREWWDELQFAVNVEAWEGVLYEYDDIIPTFPRRNWRRWWCSVWCSLHQSLHGPSVHRCSTWFSHLGWKGREW